MAITRLDRLIEINNDLETLAGPERRRWMSLVEPDDAAGEAFSPGFARAAAPGATCWWTRGSG